MCVVLPRVRRAPGRIRRPGGAAQRCRDRRATGATLVEVLVATLVVAIAGLGAGVAMTTALRADRSALHRSVAAQRIDALQSRMQANPAGVAGDRYRLELGYEAIAPGDAASAECVDVGATCSPDRLAAADVAQWNAWNALVLPGGRGAIGSAAGSAYAITVMWQENSLGPSAATLDPACAQKSPPETLPGLRCLTRVVLR